MKFTIRNKIILSNIIIILLAVIVISTIVVQGMLRFNVQQSEDQLIDISNNSNLYIQQYILNQQLENDSFVSPADILINNNTYLIDQLASQSNTRIQLFDQAGQLLGDSAALGSLTDVPEDIPTELQEERHEIDIALEQGEKAYVVRDLDEGRYIYFASPIIMENQQLGALSFLYSLEDVDRLISQSIILFIIATILGILVIYFVSFFLSRRILKPIYDLITSSEKISKGNYQYQIDYVSNDEIGNLTNSFNLMANNIREKITEINNEKQKLQSVLSSVEDGIIAVDKDGKILTFNESAKNIFAIKNNFSMKNIFSFGFMKELYKDVREENRNITKEVVFRDLNLLIYTNVICFESNNIGYIFVIRDISKIRELEEKQQQFISSVSHELRTPLTTVIGYSDMVERRGVDNPELVEKSVKLIKKEGERLLRLVNDLLNLSNFEDMEFDLIKSQLDLMQLLDDVVTQMRVKGRKYNNEIFFTSSELPKINGDYDRLKQVFINIVDNAIKYSPPGNIIQIHTEEMDEFAVVFIRDFGVGISQDNLEKIFEPFYRVDKVRTRDLGGTGLGLAIVKEIIEKHDGSIQMESKIDEGTLVVVKLPIL